MSAVMFKKLGVAAATGLVLAQGCRYSDVNTQHCNYNDGDAYCAAQYPDGSRPYCESGLGECVSPGSGEHGCVAERPANECYSPCGGRSTIDENGECVVVEDSSTGTSSGTDTGESSSGESSTTGPMPCLGNEDCPDAAAPFCELASGECVACDAFGAEGDAACAGLDPMAPLCVNGACVACTPENPVVCDDQLLLCDGDTNTCIQCTEHAQCGSGACELAVGRCFPDDFVVHVDGDAGAIPMPDYTSITAAVNAVDDGTHGIIVVHEYGMDGETPYAATVTINNGKTIALLAAQGENPIIQGTGTNPGLRVEGAGTVLYMDGVQVSQSTGRGVEVTEAFAWVDRGRIVGNDGGGIVAEDAAELTLRNCFVGGNVPNVEALILDGADADITYSTVVAGNGDLGQESYALSCVGAFTADVRNSILLAVESDVEEVDCGGASISTTVTENRVAGAGNEAVGPLQLGWFTNLTDDFHLEAMAPIPFATTARWQTDDPSTDIDGDPRPMVEGTADFAGADVVP